jgi:hypothetical protein
MDCEVASGGPLSQLSHYSCHCLNPRLLESLNLVCRTDETFVAVRYEPLSMIENPSNPDRPEKVLRIRFLSR